MGTNLICKSHGLRCTPSMRFLGLLKYNITVMLYHKKVEALEPFLWNSVLDIIHICLYIFGLNEYMYRFVCGYINHWCCDISS